MRRRVIVGEVVRTWIGEHDAERPPISRSFEEVIAMNAERGYALRDWRMTAVMIEGTMIQTIVAVFVDELPWASDQEKIG